VPEDPITSPHRAVGVTLRPSKMPVLNEACLVVLYGESIGRRIPLRDGAIVIGRAAEADLQFEEEAISRKHCRIEPVSVNNVEQWTVTDLQSTNGTFVNDRAITTATLQHGDRVQVGRTICKFLATGHVEAAYYEEIHRLVTSDGLTGLSNRRAFGEALAREFSRSARYRRPLSLLLLDIDFFKNINDTHGHLAGDMALRTLGQLLRGNLRREDIVGRIGGEEFAVILPEIDLDGARVVAEKIRNLVAENTFKYDEITMQFTVSIGVVIQRREDTDPDELLRRADELLYTAKRSGRNKVSG
jgi:two-component system, cell cycle response regulator